MKPLSTTTRRLLLAFAALFLLFGAASSSALLGLNEVHDGLHQVKQQEAGGRALLELSRAVRDQYAHQAHTIILGDATHARMYEEAQQRVARLTADLLAHVNSPEEREAVREIERTSLQIDGLFHERLLPAVLARETTTVLREHDALLDLVTRIEATADGLADRAEAQIGRFEEHAGAVQHDALRWTLILLVGATLFAGALGLYLGRSVARPVALLEAGAARIASGDLRTPIVIAGDDEFARLARRFNAMTRSIAEHQEQLVQTEKLAGVGRLAAGVAHEINNPLGVILGYARLLSQKSDGQLRDDLKIIEDEALRCRDIVEELLDLARPIRVDDAEVDLAALCADVTERLRDSGALDGVAVTLAGSARVHGSEARLRQVVLNLVRNAVDAARPSGQVEVRLERDEANVRLSVADTGAGVSEEHRHRLFEPFFTTRASGTGLGLAVSRAIALAHAGDIEVGDRPGGGAVFTLRLPLQEAR